MHVEVGPVPSPSAVAYADFAEAVLAGQGDDLPEDVRVSFTAYLHEWRTLAARGPHLTWRTEIDVEVGEYLVLAFYRLAQQVDATRPDDRPLLPAEVTPFYQALVQGLLAGMADAGPAAAEFSDHLRSFWPGQGDG